MRTREFPVLAEEDGDLVDALARGLGTDAARALAYLLLREDESTVAGDPADRLAVRVGTGLNRRAASEALSTLVDRGHVDETTRQTERGRPPKAWHTDGDVGETIRRVYETHASVLVRRAVRIAGELDDAGAPPTVDVEDALVGGPESESGVRPSADPASGPGERLSVGLNWHPNALHAPLYAARANGRYADRGLDVEVRPYVGSGAAIGGVLTGDVDVVLAGAATTMRHLADGAPLVPLAPFYQRSMAVLYTTRDAFGGRLESVDQLRGRRVGMPVGAETELLGRLFLSQSGVLDDVTVVDVAGEEQTALELGRADVVTGTMTDPPALDADDVTVDALPVADRFPIYGPTLVTTAETMRERPVTLAALLAGTIDGWDATASDPATAVQTVAGDAEPDERAVDDVARALSEFGTSTDVAANGWGWQTVDGWHRLETALEHGGLLLPSP